jgi:predicted transcriptional regulator
VLELSIDEPNRLRTIAHALSSDVRIKILKLLSTSQENIVEIAEKLILPISTVASHIKVLEEAGLIVTEIQRASRGTMKVCSRTFDDIYMNLNQSVGYNNPKNCYEIEMPIGHYADCNVHPTCGIMNANGIFPSVDNPAQFYHPDRVTAQLIWFRKGFVVYKFPLLSAASDAKMDSIQFSMELCSEAPRYDHNWPSDITIQINDKEIGTWTSPGDFGDRRGNLNPSWFPAFNTQYGLLKTWKVERQGSYLDDVKISDVTLEDLKLEGHQFVSLKIEVKANATNIGGINLFGKGLGDYSQDIIMRIMYS